MNTIDFVQHKPFKSMITTAAYLFQKKGKFRDWVFGKMVKCGWFVPYGYEEIKYSKHTLRLDDSRKLIDEQCRTVYELQGKRPTRMFIGRDQWSELVDTMGRNGVLACFAFSPYGGERPEYMGMTVEVVPWMNGIILLP